MSLAVPGAPAPNTTVPPLPSPPLSTVDPALQQQQAGANGVAKISVSNPPPAAMVDSSQMSGAGESQQQQGQQQGQGHGLHQQHQQLEVGDHREGEQLQVQQASVPSIAIVAAESLVPGSTANTSHHPTPRSSPPPSHSQSHTAYAQQQHQQQQQHHQPQFQQQQQQHHQQTIQHHQVPQQHQQQQQQQHQLAHHDDGRVAYVQQPHHQQQHMSYQQQHHQHQMSAASSVSAADMTVGGSSGAGGPNLEMKDEEDPVVIQEALENLKLFLATAPSSWEPDQIIKRFALPTGEYVSCVLWNNLFHITGTDIVRCLLFRFKAFGRPVKHVKKFEEGVFSDLRNLKPGVDASLEDPRSEFLEYLFKANCIRTQKKQKVFYWFSVPHDRLFM
ncbi:homeodomain transcription factor ste12, partial [Blyttiomyces sp. JEL0837]